MSISLDDVPNEILLEIFSRCSVEDLVLNIQHVNSRWRSLARHPNLWQNLAFFPERSTSVKKIVTVLRAAPYLHSVILVANVEHSVIETLCECCPKIKSLQFYDTRPVTVVMLKMLLASLPNIEYLTLRSMDIDSEDFGYILSKFDKVRYLSLLHTFYTGSTLMRHLADGCKSLEYLRLDGIEVRDDSILYFIAKKGSQLKGLVLDGYGFGFTATSLTPIKICQKLIKLRFYDCSQLTEECFQNIVLLPELQILQIPNASHISPSTIKWTFRRIHYPRIVEIDLTNSRLDDSCAEVLSQSCRNLQRLCVAMCKSLTDEGLKFICRCHKLQQLNVKGCNITDEGMQYLPQLPRLKHLNISRNDITDEGINYVLNCKQLVILKLNNCSVSYTSILNLSSHLNELMYLSILNNAHEMDFGSLEKIQSQKNSKLKIHMSYS
ncbi:F-box/LRR-repeat protein 2-like [Schistocerca gregaria]|uniref:F-box/LRR-repeat protein 2-like n=1 Tax=Schistocerca gregaria TaxID=7010 RepID=UPI00211DB89F|nr:F-box/LRR-repeat protein 2-like [Schistocerca gregaria]XP_049833702.1 F-box/LRR-repeat protein 2-like [Schistocerca gregaria]